MYRFKTEQEFINVFGDEWRNDVLYSFPESMDIFLGREIKSLISDYDSTDSFEKLIKKIMDKYGKSISSQMLVKTNSTEDNNIDKFLELIEKIC